MAQLTVKKLRITEQATVNTLTAVGDVFEGSALGLSAGGARQLVAGDRFLGFAKEDAASGVDVQIDPPGQGGRVIVDVIGVGVNSVGGDVYASDGDTFTLTIGANTMIGTVLRIVSGITCVVQT